MKIRWPKARRGIPRRGITLLETLVLITAVGSVLGVCAVMIQLLLRLGVEAQDRAKATMSLERLARQLRHDSHACDSARVEEKGAGKPANVRLEPEPKRAIAYLPELASVTRIETHGGRVVRRESYALSSASAPRFELRAEGARPLLVLVLSRLGGSQHEPRRPVEIVSLLGKDRALGSVAKGGLGR
jgi:hypothetical protein